MQDPLANSPGYALRRASNAMMAELAQRLAELDLRTTDATVLMVIEANPKITASEIGRMLDIQRANMVPLLKRLEDPGLISRKPIDGKSQGLHLTEEGATRMDAVRKAIVEFETDLIARVPEAHRDHFLPALDSLWR